MRLGITWIVGGVLVAVAVLPYAWRSSLPSPFSWFAVAGALLLVAAVIWTAVAGRSWLAMLGTVLLFLGWLTAFFGGLVLALVGLLVYLLGVLRSKIAHRVGLIAAVSALAAAFAVGHWVPSQLAALELGALAAVLAGVAVLRGPSQAA